MSQVLVLASLALVLILVLACAVLVNITDDCSTVFGVSSFVVRACSSEKRERVVHLEPDVLYTARSRRRTCPHRATCPLSAQVRERVLQQHGNGRGVHQ